MEIRCLLLLFAFVRCAQCAKFDTTSVTALHAALAGRQGESRFPARAGCYQTRRLGRHAPPFGSPSAPRSARGQGRLPAARGFV